MLNLFQKHKFIESLLAFFILIIFVFLILNNPNFNMYNSDEFHAYCIAKQFGLIDIIRLMREEGHSFIWYIILKPIPYEKWCFPFALKLLSFTFAFIAMVLLWFKSNFSNWEKILITFTFPMLSLYPILARPYSIGIMFLFILTILYKNRLEHPNWFAVLIFLAANTSLMATVGAFSFSIIFLYDLIKIKKENIVCPILILSACACILIIQWHSPDISSLSQSSLDTYYFLFKNYSHHIELFKNLSLIIFPVFLIVSTLFLKNNPRILFFFWLNTILLVLIFQFLYNGYSYHHYFIYIYWLISYWIQLSEGNKGKYFNVFVIFFTIITIMFNTYNRNSDFWFSKYERYKEDITFLNESVPDNSTIYCTLLFHEYFYLYKDKMHFSLKSYNGDDLFTFNTYMNIHNPNYQKSDIEKITNNAKENSYLLLTSDEIKNQPELLEKVDSFIPCNLVRNENYLIKIK